MLVVLSDLHFEEVARDRVSSPATGRQVAFDERNLSPDAFEMVFGELATSAVDDGARELHVVLAGDIFDLHRTQIWLDDELRPYTSCSEIHPGSALEAKVLRILDAIAREPPVAGSLEAIRRLAGGRYVAADEARTELAVRVPTRVTYLPGNHDRLANATPAIRARTRELLGLSGGGDPFPHQVQAADPRVLVRHGHEYDPLNFGARVARDADIPETFPDSNYDDWTFGDFVTIEVAIGLPRTFLEMYSARIADDEVLSRIYLRLLQFDDVRPQSKLVPFLLSIPGTDAALVWRYLEPAVARLLDGLRANPRLPAVLAKGGVSSGWTALLDTRFWRFGLPLWMVRRLGAMTSGGGARGDDPADAARRESLVRSASKRFVIAGHTHHPQLALLANESGFEQYFVDTGTWRNAVLCSTSGDFANTKALTYVTVYASDEDRNGRTSKAESFDYWSGFTKRW